MVCMRPVYSLYSWCCTKFRPWETAVKYWKDPIWKKLILIYLLTFVIVLPILCSHLKFSIYYIQETKKQGETRLKAENDLRLENIEQYKRNLSPRRVKNMLMSDRPTDLAVTIITAKRNKQITDLYQPRYLTQTVWTFLQLLLKAQTEGFNLAVQLSVCNVDGSPDSHQEAASLASVVPVVNRFAATTGRIPADSIFEKEKQDYVFCLETAQKANPRYVLLLEDDALPNEDFFIVLDQIIHRRLDYKISQGYLTKDNVTYVKLYHPERIQTFISLEPDRLPELFGLSCILGTVLAYSLQCKANKNALTWSRTRLIWLWCIVYVALAALAIGRPNIVSIRRIFPPYFYSYTKAPHCCTPAMLFPAASARSTIDYLTKTRCYKGFAKDTALHKYVTNRDLTSLMVQPNLVTHIGHYSSIRNKKLDPFVV